LSQDERWDFQEYESDTICIPLSVLAGGVASSFVSGLVARVALLLDNARRPRRRAYCRLGTFKGLCELGRLRGVATQPVALAGQPSGRGILHIEDLDSAVAFDTDPLPMLDRKHFFAPNRVHVSYSLAGGFMGFLIRRFGWDHYRRFYSTADRWTFRPVFQRQFGMSFEAA
jgi:hypothetical protein